MQSPSGRTRVIDRRPVLACALMGLFSASTVWAQGNFREDFDDCRVGPLYHGGWDSRDGYPHNPGIVTAEQSRSAPHSLAICCGADAIHPFEPPHRSGQFPFRAYVYVPSDLDEKTSFVIHNVYDGGGAEDRAVEIEFDPISGLVHEWMQELYGDGVDDGFTYLNLITDEWVEIRGEVDLDANYVEVYYNGSLLSWGEFDTNLDGAVELANIELRGSNTVPVYYDDLSINGFDDCLGLGLANCNGDDAIDTRDFVCFLSAWAAAFQSGNYDETVDCFSDGVINTRDFMCFLELWAWCV